MSVSLAAYLIGLVFLLHSGYSSFEFNHWVKLSGVELSLPLDIIFEALIGIVVICFGAINSIENSPFLSIKNEKLTSDSKYLKPIEMKSAVREFEKIGINDYQKYLTRIDFIDIHEKRRQFQEWVNQE